MSQLAFPSISVVCVYNDLAVRQDCLDRSLERYINARDADLSVEYIPVDNTGSTFKSAGAALNHGASAANNDVIVFVHQDVFFHSIEAVVQAAREMGWGNFGILGAVGVRTDGRIVGSVRDRTVLLGDPVTGPVDVDSVDELLFMVPRPLVMRVPLSEAPGLAWHAYAVEYGLRVREIGMRVGAADIPVTHNSLTNNLARLDEAHARVAARYREMLPIRTTCGVLTEKTVRGSFRSWLTSLASRCRQAAATLAAARKVHRYGGVSAVHADIRFEIDELISQAPDRRIHVFNKTSGTRFAGNDGPLELKRLGRSVLFSAGELKELLLAIDHQAPDEWLLLTNMTPEDIAEADVGLVRRDHVVGFHLSIGYWMLVGVGLAGLPPHLRRRRLSSRGVLGG